MHNLLTAKVPDIELDFPNLPGLNVYPLGFVFVGVEAIVEQAVNQGGLADAALTDDEELGFIQCSLLVCQVLNVEVEDGCRFVGFL